MTYGSETCVLKTITVETLVMAQSKMEQIMLGILSDDRNSNTWIRQLTGVKDIIEINKMGKQIWHLRDNRCDKVDTKAKENVYKTAKDKMVRRYGPWFHIA